MKKIMRLLGLAILAFVMAGCATQSDLMQVSKQTKFEPTKDKALIVFLRPSFFGGAVQSSVYEIGDKSDKLAGIVSAKTKTAYLTTPGEKLFMVIGENADFMKATLDAGKTYYALVSPRMGVWKARFSLLPIHNDTTSKYNTESDEFKDWISSTQYVETSPAAYKWYEDNKADINAKKAEYLEKWNAMLPADKAVLTLHAKDGK